MSRFHSILLLVAAIFFATGAARTTHMLVHHGPGSNSSCAVSHSVETHIDHGEHGTHHHGETPSNGETPSDDSHDDSCEICAVLAAMASPDAGDIVQIVPVTEPGTSLLADTRSIAPSANRTPRSSRGPPAIV